MLNIFQQDRSALLLSIEVPMVMMRSHRLIRPTEHILKPWQNREMSGVFADHVASKRQG
jgi:hypothetical protein